MTHDEFWSKVRKAGPWHVGDNGGAFTYAVRNDENKCPMEVVTGSYCSIDDMAAALPEVPRSAITNIVRASDHRNNPRRSLLLRALGLA